MTTVIVGGEGSASSPGRSLPPEKDPVPIVQEAGWAPGPVWTGAENLAPTGIRSPDRPARSQSLYRLRYPTHDQLSGPENFLLGSCFVRRVCRPGKVPNCGCFECESEFSSIPSDRYYFSVELYNFFFSSSEQG
jgi:hypothetical protein